MMQRTLARGMYCPVPCFFDVHEEIDYASFVKHVVHISQAGCLPLISGTLGEAVHLDRDERTALIKAARVGLDHAGLEHVAIVAGAGAASTRESIELAQDAAAAGADAVLVVVSGYYTQLLQKNMEAVEKHFIDIAGASPIPVMIYDSVYVTGGMDLSHQLIVNVAQKAPNSCGVKLTCPNLGKMTRLCDTIHREAFDKIYPRANPKAPFLLLTGLIDNVLAAATVDADGCIGGPPNFCPYASARLWQLSQMPLRGASLEEAKRLQGAIARADSVVFEAGAPALKQILHRRFGFPPYMRKPVPTMDDKNGAVVEALLAEILTIEDGMQAKAMA